jgi:hypothetical protein
VEIWKASKVDTPFKKNKPYAEIQDIKSVIEGLQKGMRRMMLFMSMGQQAWPWISIR